MLSTALMPSPPNFSNPNPNPDSMS
jgi:hypothetical protein